MTNTLISQTLTSRLSRRRLLPIAACFAAAITILLGPCTTRLGAGWQNV